MAEKFDFDQRVNRKGSDSVKWGKYKNKDIIPLWVADGDFKVAPAITDALKARVEHGVFGYPQSPTRLIELIVERMQRLHGWTVEANWIVLLPGVVGGMHLACQSNGDADSSIFTPATIYPDFPKIPALMSRNKVTIPMCKKGDHLVIDLDWLAKQPAKAGDVLLFCNPQNPGGAVYTKAELQILADIIVEKDLILCSDEIHCDLILGSAKKHIPIASLNAEIKQRSITLMAPSKTFNIAGLGSSYAIVPDATVRKKFTDKASGIVPFVNVLGYVAAEAAYESGGEWHRQQLEYLIKNRDYLMSAINKIQGLQMEPLEATFLAWINVSELKLKNPTAFFEAAGVGLSSGASFGDKEYMRLNFACSRGLLEEAVERMGGAVAGLG